MRDDICSVQDALDYMADLGPSYDYARRYVSLTGIIPEWLSRRVIDARRVRLAQESRKQSLSDMIRRIQRLKLKGIS